MAKKKAKKRTLKDWSGAELKRFRKMVKSGIPTSKIAKTLKRTAASVRSKAQKFGISLGGGRGGNRKKAARRR
jgi:hypothetical protein